MPKTENSVEMEDVLNSVFDTQNGQKFLLFLINYCRYWAPTYALKQQGFTLEEIVAYNNVIKNCIFRYLDPQKVGVLMKKARGEN